MELNEKNWEDFYLKALDGELSPKSEANLKGYLIGNPDHAHTASMLDRTHLKADTRVVYPHKDRLMKPTYVTKNGKRRKISKRLAKQLMRSGSVTACLLFISIFTGDISKVSRFKQVDKLTQGTSIMGRNERAPKVKALSSLAQIDKTVTKSVKVKNVVKKKKQNTKDALPATVISLDLPLLGDLSTVDLNQTVSLVHERAAPIDVLLNTSQVHVTHSFGGQIGAISNKVTILHPQNANAPIVIAPQTPVIVKVDIENAPKTETKVPQLKLWKGKTKKVLAKDEVEAQAVVPAGEPKMVTVPLLRKQIFFKHHNRLSR